LRAISPPSIAESELRNWKRSIFVGVRRYLDESLEEDDTRALTYLHSRERAHLIFGALSFSLYLRGVF
jgi:hypothetical protein